MYTNKAITFLSLFLLVCTGCVAADLKQPDNLIQLTNASDIKDAQALQNTVDAMSKKVTSCVENKMANSKECVCKYSEEFNQIKVTYVKTISFHPSWKDQAIFWWRDESHTYSHSLSLKELKLQLLERKCPT